MEIDEIGLADTQNAAYPHFFSLPFILSEHDEIIHALSLHLLVLLLLPIVTVHDTQPVLMICFFRRIMWQMTVLRMPALVLLSLCLL